MSLLEANYTDCRNTWTSTILLTIAWCCYVASLALPTIDLFHSGDGIPGYGLLFILAFPLTWFPTFGLGFVCFLANFLLAVSPFVFPMRPLIAGARVIYPALLAFTALVASVFAIGQADQLGSGAYFWGLAMVLTLIAFCLPLEESPHMRPTHDRSTNRNVS